MRCIILNPTEPIFTSAFRINESIYVVKKDNKRPAYFFILTVLSLFDHRVRLILFRNMKTFLVILIQTCLIAAFIEENTLKELQGAGM